MAQKADNWSSTDYQHSASFVPKLAGKVMQWLDPQPDDRIIDIGCGDGILSVDIASVLAQGSGHLIGLDSSPDMIESAKRLTGEKGLAESKCAFNGKQQIVVDAANVKPTSAVPANGFTKIFSNAALHWILTPVATRKSFFDDMHVLLAPGGKLVFECGGRGNVADVRAAFLGVLGRRVGLEKAAGACPWFFPDEEWIGNVLTREKGWVVERSELEYRPTKTDIGGVEGWVRLMGREWFAVVGEEEGKEREEAVGEAVGILEEVCKDPERDGWRLGYVRLRVEARKV